MASWPYWSGSDLRRWDPKPQGNQLQDGTQTQEGPESNRGPKSSRVIGSVRERASGESGERVEGLPNRVGSYNRGAPRAGLVGVRPAPGLCLPNG